MGLALLVFYGLRRVAVRQVMETGAIFDASRQYRYALWRRWDKTIPKVVFIMLNPSTADATTNDPTICRCVRFAQAWGYGGLEVVNLFALMATDPQQLKAAIDPIGQACDQYLLDAVRRADRVVIAWGNWGSLQQRDQAVLALLAPKMPLYCLGMNRSGQPRHPLYLPKTPMPLRFDRKKVKNTNSP